MKIHYLEHIQGNCILTTQLQAVMSPLITYVLYKKHSQLSNSHNVQKHPPEQPGQPDLTGIRDGDSFV